MTTPSDIPEKDTRQAGTPKERPPFRPSDLMRRGHPELFSDSAERGETRLDRSDLDSYLENLTSRNQESQFAEFARRLSELEVCPNIKPQTGPTGGGDSGVDGSTHPVSPYLAERVYFGTPIPSTSEQWGFAFSTKKRWKEKAKSDVAKAAAVLSDATKIFFVTSRFARDRDRAALEAELSKQHQRNVHILDRTWILNRVFEHQHQDLVVKHLGFGTALRSERKLGPRDTHRQAELAALLTRLKDPANYLGNDLAIAQDYLSAALYSRALEEPRHEVEGLFARARAVALHAGDCSQVLAAGYHLAWTLFWWFDDEAATANTFAELAPLLAEVDSSDDVELFVNLLALMRGAFAAGRISAEQAGLTEWADAIRSRLEEIKRDRSRPSNALTGQTVLYLLELHNAATDEKRGNATLLGLKECLERSRGHVGYPAMHYIRDLTKLGRILDRFPAYADLFETMTDIAVEREGEARKGELLLQRGKQLLEGEKTSEGIPRLLEAMLLLAKRETAELAAQAAVGAAIGFTMLKLPWAARLEALFAADCAQRLLQQDKGGGQQFCQSLVRLAYLDLSLGRIGPLLCWMQCFEWVKLRFASEGFEVDEMLAEIVRLEAVLAAVFAAIPVDRARRYEGVARTLAERGLPIAAAALFANLGYSDRTRELLKAHPILESYSTVDDFIVDLRRQPAASQTAPLGSETEEFWQGETTQLGVRFIVRARNDTIAVLIAENLLGILELVLSRARWESLAFAVDEFEITIDVASWGANPPSISLEALSDTGPLVLMFARDAEQWMAEHSSGVQEFMRMLVLSIMTSITMDPLEDLKAEFVRWHENGAMNTIAPVTPSSVLVRNLLGDMRYDLGFWSTAT